MSSPDTHVSISFMRFISFWNHLIFLWRRHSREKEKTLGNPAQYASNNSAQYCPILERLGVNKKKNYVSSIYYKMPRNFHAETSNCTFLKRPASKKLCVHKNTLRTTKKGAHAIINSFGSKKPPKFDIFQIYNRNINDFLGLENRRNRGCRKYSLFSHWRMLRAFKKFLLSLYFAFITLRVFVECWQKSCTVNLISLISVIFLKILVVI